MEQFHILQVFDMCYLVNMIAAQIPKATRFGALHLMGSEAKVPLTIKELETLGIGERGSIGGLHWNQLCDRGIRSIGCAFLGCVNVFYGSLINE